MSTTRTAESPRLDQASRYASSPSIVGPRLPQTIVARATSERPEPIRDTLRSVAGHVIAENLPLERIAQDIDCPVENIRRAICDPDYEIPVDVLTNLSKFVQQKNREIEAAPFVETAISRVVEDVLEHAASERLLAVIVGDYRTGKSYDAKRWASLNRRRAVYLEVPSGADKNIFMRAIGQKFAIGTSTATKATQIEWKIRQACKDWQPILILDEAHRLWNEDARHVPQRVEFVRDLMSPEIGASVVCIATNQFANAQERAETHAQTWGSGQWVGRIGRYEELPSKLPEKELRGIIEVHLPQAGEKAVEAVFQFALSSDGYLGSIESVAKMARHLARKAKSERVLNEHILNAVRALIPTSRVLRKQFGKVRAE